MTHARKSKRATEYIFYIVDGDIDFVILDDSIFFHSKLKFKQ